MDNVNVFFEQGDTWRDDAEPYLADARRKVERVDPVGSPQLAASAPYEVDACTRAFRGDFVGSREAALLAARALSGEEAARSYRALWLYLAAVWSFAATGADANAGKTGAGLLQEANKAAFGTTWLRETEAGAESIIEEDADDTPAIREIVRRLENGIKQAQVESAVERISTGLAATEHTKFEPASTELGRLLGAEAEKPSGQGRADSVWCWEGRVWIAIEAKTEEGPDQPVPLKDVRQANTQLAQLSEDRGVPAPTLAAVVIACARTQVADEAVTAAQSHVFLTHPDVFRGVLEDAARAWSRILMTRKGHTGRDLEALVRKVMAEHQVLPTQVYERLTAQPVHS